MSHPKAPKILVIDDDLDILTAIEASLELPGMEPVITTAHNALVGLQQAKLWKPDLVILDLNLPDMNGMEVLKEIKQDGQLAHTKVILLTAQDTGKNLWEGLDRGVDD
ncbi:MAG TPA: response regulator, partial [Candidatus Saccharimonadales bacterium]|nr:response regulator [Candidatus Saccharimonadales bacterium]